MRRWTNFLAAYNLQLAPGEGVTPGLLALYITYLYQDPNVNSANTISQYVSGGPRQHHTSMGLTWGAMLSQGQAAAAWRAVQRYLAGGTNTNRKSGITLQQLAAIRGLLVHPLASTRDACIWAAFLTAFFALLRKSNVACITARAADRPTPPVPGPAGLRQPPPPPSPVLRRGDVTRQPDGSLLLTFQCTKTRQPGSGRPRLQAPLPLITAPLRDARSGAATATHALCPSAALLAYLRLTPGRPATEPLFGWPGRRPGEWQRLTHAVFVSALKDLLRRIGVDATQYSGQSFRRGGASFAHNTVGLSPLYIKALGDWLSNAFELYIEADDHLRALAQRRVAASVADALP